MTRFTKSANGKYMVHGKSFETLTGSRAQVWHGTAYKTSGGLTKINLMQNKSGRIVSKAKHGTAKKDNRLVKAGYGTKKGTFGYVKLNKTKKGGRYSRMDAMNNVKNMAMNAKNMAMNARNNAMAKGGKKTKRGGMYALSPTPYNGKGVGTSGVAVQFTAGNAS